MPDAWHGSMAARRYQDLVCWQLAHRLKLRVYAVTATTQVAKDVKYCDQVRESIRSAERNIAEGFGRFRPAEFAKFLTIARGSLVETHNHLCDGADLAYLSRSEHTELCALADRATGAVTQLLLYLQRRRERPHRRGEPRT
jgi:four helix bundle protein